MGTPALGPYVALYCREVLGDVDIATLKDDQFGRLVRYWMVCSEIGGRLPGDPQEIAQRSRVDVRKVRHDLSWFPRFFVWDETSSSWISERMERQALKYAKKVAVAHEVGTKGTPQMGDAHDPHPGPHVGVDQDPQMGVSADPPNRSYARGTQTQSLRITTHTNNPPYPPPGEPEAKAPKKPKRKPLADQLLEIPEVQDRHLQAAARIKAMWRKNDPSDGRVIGCDTRMLVMRLVQIESRQPLYTMAVLEESGALYCAKDLPRFSAPEYFFSLKPNPNSAQAPFKELADAVVNRLRRQTFTEPPLSPAIGAP